MTDRFVVERGDFRGIPKKGKRPTYRWTVVDTSDGSTVHSTWSKDGYEARKAAEELNSGRIQPPTKTSRGPSGTTNHINRPHIAVRRLSQAHSEAERPAVSGQDGGASLAGGMEPRSGGDMPLWEITGLGPNRELIFEETNESRPFGAFAPNPKDPSTWFLNLDGDQFGLGSYDTARAIAQGLSAGKRLESLRIFPAGVDAMGNPVSTIVRDGRLHWDD